MLRDFIKPRFLKILSSIMRSTDINTPKQNNKQNTDHFHETTTILDFYVYCVFYQLSFIFLTGDIWIFDSDQHFNILDWNIIKNLNEI